MRSRTSLGFTLLEVVMASTIFVVILGISLGSYQAAFAPSKDLRARSSQIASSSNAVYSMNQEFQEASVDEAAVEIFATVLPDGTLTDPLDPSAVPPGETVYPQDAAVDDPTAPSFAVRFRTIGRFAVDAGAGGIVAQTYRGPVVYRLGTGDANDRPTDRLVRLFDPDGANGPTPPLFDRELCRNVRQVAFQRNSRGGGITVTLVTERPHPNGGPPMRLRERFTVTPRNNFGTNLQNEAEVGP